MAEIYWNISRMECKAEHPGYKNLLVSHWNISRMECKEITVKIAYPSFCILEYIQNGM